MELKNFINYFIFMNYIKFEKTGQGNQKMQYGALARLKSASIDISDVSAICTLEDIKNELIYKNNIEKYIGTMKIPIGLVGPVLVNGKYAKGIFHVPLATTEGALVASYDRGSRICRMAGGVTAYLSRDSVSRAPGFTLDNFEEAARFGAWLETKFQVFSDITASASRYAKLLNMEVVQKSKYISLVLDYYTGNASGQNMVTVCSQKIIDYIKENSPVEIRLNLVEGGLSSDKTPSYYSVIKGRGKSVFAEAIIPKKIVEKKLNTTVQDMFDAYSAFTSLSKIRGDIAMNFHCANALAAFYMACGQDVACTAESSVANTSFSCTKDGDLHVSLSMPVLMTATVGGGTGLPTSSACLRVMGIRQDDENGARKLAEILAAICLAGEISITGAMAAGEFTRAHVRHGRGVKV